jgi:hypothetical protein
MATDKGQREQGSMGGGARSDYNYFFDQDRALGYAQATLAFCPWRAIARTFFAAVNSSANSILSMIFNFHFDVYT